MSVAVRNRRGVALLAALWLVVAIATVALALGVEAAEHRTVGLAAADGAAASAAAAGAIAIAQARLEQVLRSPPRLTGPAANLRAADPWLEADSLFPEPITFGTVVTTIRVEDLSSKVGINLVDGTVLRNFLAFVLRDHQKADQLAQAILDWRDGDDFPTVRGAERKDYVARKRLDLPQNRLFRTPDELRFVEGMTPALTERLRPYIRCDGYGMSDVAINVNTAPRAVLYAIPGMTDAVVARIMAKRSQRLRVQSIDELIAAGLPPNPAAQTWVKLTTDWIEVIAAATPPAPGRTVELRRRMYKGTGSISLPITIDTQ